MNYFRFLYFFFPKAVPPKDNGMWREWAPLGGIGTSVLSNYYRRLQKKKVKGRIFPRLHSQARPVLFVYLHN
jgi:hypothetical protein